MDRTALLEWARTSASRIRDNGVKGVGEAMRPVYHKILHQVSNLTVNGNNIYDLDWDVLIVLDACRYDLFVETAVEYDWIESVSSITSVDTMTEGWMKRTFTEDRSREIRETMYVCGNPFSSKVLDETEFYQLDEAWRYHWDPEFGTIYPRVLTDRTINYLRIESPERTIVHYMQPHWPFIPNPEMTGGRGINIDNFGDYNENDIWERLRNGAIDKKTAWDGYKRNLKYVLDDIDTLVRNVRVDNIIITSDHGNALGEWWIYGHPVQMPIDCLRKVPWARVSVEYDGTHSPAADNLSSDRVSTAIGEQLRSLGYAE
jgi:hypothetical protein